jgi:hypothetical protein
MASVRWARKTARDVKGQSDLFYCVGVSKSSGTCYAKGAELKMTLGFGSGTAVCCTCSRSLKTVVRIYEGAVKYRVCVVYACTRRLYLSAGGPIP